MDDRVIDVRTSAATGGATTVMTDDVSLLRRISSLEEENAELRLQLAVLASIDAATGLANRIGLLDAIEMASYRLARMHEPFAVVLMTFPQLDAIEDEDEHLEAIRDIGALIAAGVRSVDRVGREQASTFVSVLANIPHDDIDIVLDRTRGSLDVVSAAAGLSATGIDARVMAVSLTDPKTVLTASEILDKCHQLAVGGSGPEVHSL